MFIKGIIVSNSNNSLLYYKTEDINKKGLFWKFQLIPNLRLQVLHDYVDCYYSIDYWVK